MNEGITGWFKPSCDWSESTESGGVSPYEGVRRRVEDYEDTPRGLVRSSPEQQLLSTEPGGDTTRGPDRID